MPAKSHGDFVENGAERRPVRARAQRKRAFSASRHTFCQQRTAIPEQVVVEVWAVGHLLLLSHYFQYQLLKVPDNFVAISSSIPSHEANLLANFSLHISIVVAMLYLPARQNSATGLKKTCALTVDCLALLIYKET